MPDWCYTDTNGNYSIGEYVPADAVLHCVFQTGAWKITPEGSTTSHVYRYHETFKEQWEGNNNMSFQVDFPDPRAEAHRAASFYWMNNHPVRKAYRKNGDIPLRIEVSSRHYPDAKGYFHSNGVYISIYDNDSTENSTQMGTIFHELGHFLDYSMGGWRYNTDAEMFIAES